MARGAVACARIGACGLCKHRWRVRPQVTMGTYLRLMAVLGLEKNLALLAAEDPVGRRLQDAE
ncbi:hypothetical protein GCM10022212_15620 [Actimicrobium antarcticum]|uniref:Uncharacterized protein n=1 Tax=Actimicrobium antarcticum TaxID=1051899 RepID=A0ABP7T2G0_9BURK